MTKTIVRFAQSDCEAEWTASDFNLLEFAERLNIAVSFGCRHGICGSCKVKFESGQVKQLYRSAIDLDDDEVLLCCSIPVDDELTLNC